MNFMRVGLWIVGFAVGGGFIEPGVAGAKSPVAPHRAGESDTQAPAELQANLLRPAAKERLLPRDIKLRLAADAVAEPAYSTSLPVGARGKKVPVQTVKVDGGRVDAFFLESKTPRGVLLQGPDKVLGIATKGHMVMTVSDDSIIIAAISGDVLVGQGPKFRPLAEGSVRVFSRATGASKDVSLPEPPKLTSKAGLSVALTGSAKVPLQTTSQSVLRLAVVDERGVVVGAPQETVPGAPLHVEVPRAGVYFAVARSVGDGGIAGPLSEPHRIQVLGLARGQRGPEGGVFLLSKGERVHLAGTEGLEVRYGSSPTYVPASSSLGLSQERESLVEFRDPQNPEDRAVIRLAPRVMKTVIELGPSEARWPGQPVKMRVGLWDGVGNQLRRGKDMEVQVTVNSAKVPVNWKVTDEGHVADLPKQKGEGPWVVRVNVTDKKGRTIARDFLEVAVR